MITAADTNIFLDILVPNPDFVESSPAALQTASEEGPLVICDVVYAELCVAFETQAECDEFLASIEIRVQGLTRETLFHASRTWRNYRSQGGNRTRVIADFLIGAHAGVQANRLLTRDRGFYRSLFPSLAVLEPAATRLN